MQLSGFIWCLYFGLAQFDQFYKGVADPSEKLAPIYRLTRLHIPENCNLYMVWFGSVYENLF